MPQIMEIISTVPTTAWIIAAIVLVAAIWAVINAIRNNKAEDTTPALSGEEALMLGAPTASDNAFAGLSDELVAVITAAVYTAMGSNVRIQSIRRVGKAPRSNWAKSALAERLSPFNK